MSKEDRIELEGVITKQIKGGKYIVEVPNDHGNVEVTCTIGGKLRMNKISLIIGDNVTISVSPYDLQKGTITWRRK